MKQLTKTQKLLLIKEEVKKLVSKNHIRTTLTVKIPVDLYGSFGFGIFFEDHPEEYLKYIGGKDPGYKARCKALTKPILKKFANNEKLIRKQIKDISKNYDVKEGVVWEVLDAIECKLEESR